MHDIVDSVEKSDRNRFTPVKVNAHRKHDETALLCSSHLARDPSTALVRAARRQSEVLQHPAVRVDVPAEAAAAQTAREENELWWQQTFLDSQ